MTTWSLTPFFNELDLLEIRLATLDEVVDVHVIAEATLTFSGRRKPLHFRENAERFAPWKDKIRYVVVDDMPNGRSTVAPGRMLRASRDDNWRRENHQRAALSRGLDGMRGEDKVLISDLDEILTPEVIREIDTQKGPVLDRFGRLGRIRPSVSLHLYWLNWRWSQVHHSPIACLTNGAVMMSLNAQKVRMLPGVEFDKGHPHGWHFSYMGGPRAIQTKITSAAHQEVNRPVFNRPAWIEKCMTSGKDLFRRPGTMTSVNLNELPPYVAQNLDRFSHLIGPPLRVGPVEQIGPEL